MQTTGHFYIHGVVIYQILFVVTGTRNTGAVEVVVTQSNVKRHHVLNGCLTSWSQKSQIADECTDLCIGWVLRVADQGEITIGGIHDIKQSTGTGQKGTTRLFLHKVRERIHVCTGLVTIDIDSIIIWISDAIAISYGAQDTDLTLVAVVFGLPVSSTNQLSGQFDTQLFFVHLGPTERPIIKRRSRTLTSVSVSQPLLNVVAKPLEFEWALGVDQHGTIHTTRTI